MARHISQESIRRYWSNRVGIPSAIIAVALVLFVVGFLFYSMRDSEKRTLDAAGSTLAMVVSDPILLGDELEVQKRISAVAKRHDLSVVVRDMSHRVLSTYPPTLDADMDLRDGVRYDVSANDGRIIGRVWVKRNNRSSVFDGFLILVLSLVACFSAIIVWIVRSVRPIVEDVLSLAKIDTGIGNETGNKPSFRFGETQQTYATLRETVQKLDVQARELLEIEKSKLEVDLAKQVAHDIRSPLEALRFAMPMLNALPEDVRISIRSAFFRIEDIANTLLQKETPANAALENPCVQNPEGRCSDLSQPSVQLLSSLIEPLVSEKRMQYRSKITLSIEASLNPSSYGLFAQVHPSDFKRILSNMIDNGVQALRDEAGMVSVSISCIDNEILLEIKDTGSGIPSELIAKLGQKGLTTKPNGNGLGLFHAKAIVSTWGGKFEIQSVLGQGTAVQIRIPRSPSPTWFVPELALDRNTTVCILDDDQTIHQLWLQRFESLIRCDGNLKLVHFSTGDDMATWCNEHRSDLHQVLYLCDFELLGQKKNGLVLIEELGIQSQSVLVTSRYEESEVRTICERLGVRRIPKGLARLVPISIVQKHVEKHDYYLIDDDFLVELLWSSAARRNGKRVKYFKSPVEFVSVADALCRETPVYIDNDFGKGVERGELTSQRIREMGFKKVFLATGSPASLFEPMPWLDGIVSKAPPWEVGSCEQSERDVAGQRCIS